MKKVGRYKKEILLLFSSLVIIFFLMLILQGYKAFHIVLRENADAIQTAGVILTQNMESETMAQTEMETFMRYYGSTTLDAVQAINGISEHVWFYQRYKLRNFENFLVAEVLMPGKSMKQMQENYQIILQIQEELQAMTKPEDTEPATSHYAQIESICAAWYTPY